MEEHKNTIAQKIDEISALDLSKLYPDNSIVELWDQRTNAQIKQFVDSNIAVLKKLRSNLALLDSLGLQGVRNIEGQITGFVNSLGSLQQVAKDQITTQHHGPLNEMVNITNVLRNTGIYAELLIEPQLSTKFESFRRIEPLMRELLNKKKSLQQATQEAEEWLKKKVEVDEKTIRGQASAFQDRAKEHGHQKKWRNITYTSYDIWLVCALVAATVVGILTFYFSRNLKDILNVGQGIVRAAVILVPAYVTVFCANQYLYHKRMYEAYMFRFASLHTMNHLMSTKTEAMQEKILAKGLSVLFTEPTVKEESKKDRLIIQELLDMLKSQI